jgi:hypothetical protein
MKHNHPFFIGERVWDDNRHEWATVSMFGGSEDEGSNFLVLKNDRGELWEALYDDVYQIAEGLRTVNSGDIVCYEHNKTEDDYPYYCPFLEENFFSFEVEGVPYDDDFTEGSAYELVQKLQDAVLAIDGAEKMTVPVFVEDENGRLENITHIWYDHTRHMIRLTVGGVEFTDSEEE